MCFVDMSSANCVEAFLCIVFRRGFLLGWQPCTPIWCRVRRMVWALTGWPPTSSISAAMLTALLRRSFKESIWMWPSARALSFFGRPTRGLFWLSLRKNVTRTAITKHYDWALLNNRDIRDKYVLELRNWFETLQEKIEKGTPNYEYENFVNAHLEAAAKCIPTKPRTKYRVPWETLAVREKRAHVKTASKSYKKNPTNTNARKLKKAQNQLAGIYLKEQTEYIQNQIDKIRDSVEDRQSRIAWQTINEVSRRKSTAKAELKATNQQERIKL